MAPALDALFGVRASLLILTVAAAVTVVSVSVIRGGFIGEAWHGATIELGHAELPSVIQPGAAGAAPKTSPFDAAITSAACRS